ncbi:18104_t:CDS:1, partial [Racocetra fulgida]
LSLDECSKIKNLDDYITLCNDLKQYNLEAVRLLTKDKLKDRLEADPESKMQVFRKDKSKNLINKEFRCLKEINNKQKKLDKDLEFKKQEL